MRILIGVEEIANIGNTYAQAFRTLGHEVKLCVFQRHPFYSDTDYDHVFYETSLGYSRFLSKIAKSLPARIAAGQGFFGELNKTDLFIYLFTSSFLPFRLDYPLVKLAGKKMISVYCGSDIRFGAAVSLYAQDRGYADELQPFIDILINENEDLFLRKTLSVRVGEVWSNLVVSSPEMGQLQRKPYMRLHIPLNLENYHFKVHARVVPKLVHAPSNRGYKGTDVVLQVIEDLRAEGLKFDFTLLENVPNNEVRDILTDSDIVISQLYGDVFSTLSEEGMATGNAVVGRYVLDSVPENPPGVNANRFTLKENLREMITDVNKRVEISYAGRAYVEKYFSHLVVAQNLLNGVLSKQGLTFDYYPEFYKKLRRHYPRFIKGDIVQAMQIILNKIRTKS